MTRATTVRDISELIGRHPTEVRRVIRRAGMKKPYNDWDAIVDALLNHGWKEAEKARNPNGGAERGPSGRGREEARPMKIILADSIATLGAEFVCRSIKRNNRTHVTVAEAVSLLLDALGRED